MRSRRLLSEHGIEIPEFFPAFMHITLLDEAIQKGLLPAVATFACPDREDWAHQGVIRIIFPEFTCICPKTGYPDFASIDLYYVPDTLCIELKSWKLYLNSFRMIGTFHETVTSFLFNGVVRLIAPKWALVAGDFFPRGNVNTTILFETPTARPQGADVLLKKYNPHCRGFGE
jgi:7-cyano-7-deazaguanine reductase